MPANKAKVFIDGNNLYHCLRNMDLKIEAADFPKLCEVICEKFSLEWDTAHYYNSKPMLHSFNYWRWVNYYKELDDFSKFTVSLRKLQKNSNYEIQQKKKQSLENLGVCNGCKPVVEQNCMDCIGRFSNKEKGIDVLLAVEMIEAALKKECDYCVLVSGDGDFVPALNLILANNVKIKSVSVWSGYSSLIRKIFLNDFFVLGKEEFEKIGIKPF